MKAASSTVPAPDPFKSVAPLLLLGYLLTRPPILAVVRVLIWLALLFIRPGVRLRQMVRAG